MEHKIVLADELFVTFVALKLLMRCSFMLGKEVVIGKYFVTNLTFHFLVLVMLTYMDFEISCAIEFFMAKSTIIAIINSSLTLVFFVFFLQFFDCLTYLFVNF